MLYCGEFHKDTVKSMPTTPNIQVKLIIIDIFLITNKYY